MSKEEETSYEYAEPAPTASPTARLLTTLALLGSGMSGGLPDAMSPVQTSGQIRAPIPRTSRQRTRGKGKSKRSRR